MPTGILNPAAPNVPPYFPPWKETLALARAGHRDEAMVHFVEPSPFAYPTDNELLGIAESGSEEVDLYLGKNLFWCRLPRAQAERTLRLLRSEQLALHVEAFVPSDPAVLTGAKAEIRQSEPMATCRLPIARCEPADGYATPHRLRASLVVGPKADPDRIDKLLVVLIPGWLTLR